MGQNRPSLNCNNNINCIISPTAKVNAAANAAIKTQIGVTAVADNADPNFTSEIEKSEEFCERRKSFWKIWLESKSGEPSPTAFERAAFD